LNTLNTNASAHRTHHKKSNTSFDAESFDVSKWRRMVTASPTKWCSACSTTAPLRQFLRLPTNRRLLKVHRTCNRCARKWARRYKRRCRTIPCAVCGLATSNVKWPDSSPAAVADASSEDESDASAEDSAVACDTCTNLRGGDYAFDEFMLLREG